MTKVTKLNLPVVAAAVQQHLTGNATVEVINDPTHPYQLGLRYINRDEGFVAEVDEEYVLNAYNCLGAANYAKRLATNFEHWLCEQEGGDA
jgi:hypothetical protein